MQTTPIQQHDLQELASLQPSDWPDIVAQFRDYIEWPGCKPVKFVVSGQIVAVGCAILHADTAWLAHIIVHEDNRGQGIGTAMTRTLLDLPEMRGKKTISLVATVAGVPIYQKTGFLAETEYHFFRDGKVPPQGNESAIVNFQPEMAESILRLDREASGENRVGLLKRHLSSALCYISGSAVQAFYLPTFGEGLIVASHELAGLALTQHRLQRHEHAVAPTQNSRAIDMLQQGGFTHYRTGYRMRLGEPIAYHLDMIYNRVGGNLG